MKLEVMHFGGYDWFVLDKQDGKTLIITEKVIDKRSYHSDECEITWETCDMRKYLNGEFYNLFSEADRMRIIEVVNENPNNPWYGTSGGNHTSDKIFLLSIAEVVKYFGDGSSTKYLENRDNQNQWLDDKSNSSRIARIGKKATWVWLRSTGYYKDQAMYINARGRISMGGDRISRIGGVRPALWLKIILI